jgi:hypothetical protein
MEVMEGKRLYEVALWLRAPGGANFPQYVEVVPASFPLDAVAQVMRCYNLTTVVYAAVACLGGAAGIDVVRYRHGVWRRKEAV